MPFTAHRHFELPPPRRHRLPRPSLARALAVTVALACAAGPLTADTLVMPNGETLEGTVIRETPSHIVFASTSFGELTVTRVEGLHLKRSSDLPAPAPSASGPSSVATTTTTAPTAPAVPTAPPTPPKPRAWLQESLGLSDRWSAEFNLGLTFLGGVVDLDSYTFETTLGYQVAPHEFGLYTSFNYQKLNDTVVGRAQEAAFRYFFLPEQRRWLLVSQIDWMRDTINLTPYRYNAIAVPAYKLIARENRRLVVGIGPSYRVESRIIPGPPDTTEEHEGFRAAFYQVYHHDFNPRLALHETLLVQVDPADTSSIAVRLDATLRRMITPHLSVNLEYSYVLDENEAFENQTIRTLNVMAGYSF